ncbi:hypothetical protein HZA57_09295 [Candidatus Poribacteria bacterium]|nr:hypothetical protein [Candidatus Poribacteria bacterium]
MDEAELIQPEREGTNVRRFLAHRGAVVLKETREIGKIKGSYGDSVEVSTMIIAVVKGQGQKRTFGAKLERTDSDGNHSSAAFLDYEELEELMQAFDFILSTATDLIQHNRDYTEVTYSTKDEAQFGFFQDSQRNQQAFITPNCHGESTFLPVDRLVKVKQLLRTAQEHLVSRGAGAE